MAANVLDKCILKVCVFKHWLGKGRHTYQPLPWIGIHEAKRSAGTVSRMRAIEQFLKDRTISNGVALDVGCNIGYFSLTLKEKGFTVYGIDNNRGNVRIATAVSKLIQPGAFVGIHSTITHDNTSIFPEADVTLCLSIWHHWVRCLGIGAATEILRSLFGKTRAVLFFDTGERELTEDYNLNFDGKDPRLWLEHYLNERLNPDELLCLGRFQAFAPARADFQGEVRRHLFAVSRRT